MAAHQSFVPNVLTIDVFATGWSGAANESFNFSNGSNAPVLVQKNGNNTFPFVGGNPVSVGPGTHGYQLIGTPGTYTYNTMPALAAGNPKTVIIT
jgi:hypothetical protein